MAGAQQPALPQGRCNLRNNPLLHSTALCEARGRCNLRTDTTPVHHSAKLYSTWHNSRQTELLLSTLVCLTPLRFPPPVLKHASLIIRKRTRRKCENGNGEKRITRTRRKQPSSHRAPPQDACCHARAPSATHPRRGVERDAELHRER